MSTGKSEKRPWKERIRDKYRLIILNDETLREVSSFKLNLLNLYVLGSTLIIIVGLIVFALIVFTPLKRAIPGYGDISATPEFIALKEKTSGLEKDLTSLNNYIEANKNRLLGNPDAGNSNFSGQLYQPKELEDLDTIELDTPISLDETDEKEIRYFYPPLVGKISAEFNSEDNHHGLDILGAKNSAISAITAGTVIAAEYNLETGNTISIQHENNIVSTYKHNSKLLKSVSDYVQSGEAIAIIGNTGLKTDGYHLHFELWMNGTSVNPQNYINFTD